MGIWKTNANEFFSLVELLVVVAVLLALAALSIPVLARARMSANESAVVETLRVINKAEMAYQLVFNSGFSPDLYSLGPSPAPSPARADLVDEIIAGSAPGAVGFVRHGYQITYKQLGAYSYQITATPLTPGATGSRSFYSDHATVIRVNSSGPAGPTDPPLAN